MSRIILKNVRIAWPHLFEQNTFQGDPTGYDALFLISKKDTENVTIVKKQIQKLLVENDAKGLKSNKICFKDGDLEDKQEYYGFYILKSTSKNNQPLVLHSDKTQATKENNPIYSGCYVNASVDFWFMNNQYGKRVLSNLHAVMFSKDGDRIGNGAPSKDVILTDFDSIESQKHKDALQTDFDTFDDYDDI